MSTVAVTLSQAKDQVAPPAPKHKSKLERFKNIVKKSLLPLKGLSLSVGVFKSTTAIASCVCKLSKPLKTALTAVKVPGIVQNLLSTGLSAEEVHNCRLLAKDLNASLRAYRRATTSDEKASSLGRALKKIDEDGLKTILTRTMISDDGKDVLKDRIEALRSNIEKKSITAEDVKLVKLLARRAQIHLGLEIAELTSRCAAIAASIITLSQVPVAAEIVSASILAACAVESLVVWGATNFCINKNPLDPTSRSPLKSAFNTIERGIQHIGQRIQAALSHTRRLPALAYACV